MTDNRPRPQYGEYATPEQRLAAGGLPLDEIELPKAAPGKDGDAGGRGGQRASDAPDPALVTPGPLAQRRGWDSILTIALLSLGTYVVLSSIPGLAQFGQTVSTLFEQAGYGDYTSIGLANMLGLVLNIVQPLLLVAAILLSVRSLAKNRLSFWIPLVFGAVNFIVFFVIALVAMVSDPVFTNMLQGN